MDPTWSHGSATTPTSESHIRLDGRASTERQLKPTESSGGSGTVASGFEIFGFGGSPGPYPAFVQRGLDRGDMSPSRRTVMGATDTLLSRLGMSRDVARPVAALPMNRSLSADNRSNRERVFAKGSLSPQPMLPLCALVQNKYHGLLCLDSKNSMPVPSPVLYGYRTCPYKALCVSDSFVHCLRRVEGVNVTYFDRIQKLCAQWRGVSHPNIIPLRGVLATRDFLDAEGMGGEGTSVVFVYDYVVENLRTLEEWLLASSTALGDRTLELVMADIALQLLMAIRACGARGLSLGCLLSPSKICVSGAGRVLVNCVAMQDVLYEQAYSRSREGGPTDDLQLVARLLVKVCQIVRPASFGSNDSAKWDSIDQGIGLIEKQVSGDWITYLKKLSSTETTVQGAMADLAPFMSYKLESEFTLSDIYRGEASKAYDSQTLLELLVQVCLVSGRPNLGFDTTWGSSGERAVVQLFRDYLCFQSDHGTARPVVDMGHILSCLSKLAHAMPTSSFGRMSHDVLMLGTRDGSSANLCTYYEIRRCLEASMAELLGASTR